jgi:hypothetical protein
MGIGLTASSASNFKMNRLPGECGRKINLPFISYIFVYFFAYKVGISSLTAITATMEIHFVLPEMDSLTVSIMAMLKVENVFTVCAL